jgi:hypothetical protein
MTLTKTLALTFAFVATTSFAAEKTVTWTTPMQCGTAKARYIVQCVPSKDPDDHSECKDTQKLEFLNDAGAVAKSVAFPVYQKGERAMYEKAGTMGDMFAFNWSCNVANGKPYFQIYIVSSAMGNAEGNEKWEVYGGNGDAVLDKALLDKLARSKGSPDKPFKGVFNH